MAAKDDNFVICCLGHSNTKHCFIEAMMMIQHCIQQAGKKCQMVEAIDGRPHVTWIIFGLNVTPTAKLPANTIIVNMEQLFDQSTWLKSAYINQLKTHRVWDYNKVNQAYLRKLGINAPLISYGYMPSLCHRGSCWADSSDHPSVDQDIDVIMLGYPNPNRKVIAQQLANLGVKIQYHSGNMWGAQRNNLLLRSKILLNVHLYAANILEIPRLALAINNGMFIISESCINESEYPWMKDCVIFKPYSQLIGTILDYLKRPHDRHQIAKLAYTRFKQIQPTIPPLTN
jgi:hypothetical protein